MGGFGPLGSTPVGAAPWSDVPFADPKIRLEYEAALGAFILEFNHLDFLVTRFLECCQRRMGSAPELSPLTKGGFKERLDKAILLKAIRSDLKIDLLDFDSILKMAQHRNSVAHSHFDQNPFSGEYKLLDNAMKAKDYTTERLSQLRTELESINRQLSAVVDFYDIHDPI